MALDAGVVDSVINANFKILGETGAMGLAQANSLAALNATAHQKMMDSIRELNFMEAGGQRAGIDLAEAVAGKKLSEADLARTVSELGSAIAALQQIIKTAQTTQPVTP